MPYCAFYWSMCWNWPRRPIKGLSDGMDDSIIRYALTKVEVYTIHIGFDKMYVQTNFKIICNVETTDYRCLVWKSPSLLG